ncbi:unnamed protein product [Rangifer tarandus platyrhynchus]|uniref:Uncharacterized protein n=1 Tax=Rangifer tarandus platyrhynchus TaxID=3082113 RepID=A0AC59YH92_RANTA
MSRHARLPWVDVRLSYETLSSTRAEMRSSSATFVLTVFAYGQLWGPDALIFLADGVSFDCFDQRSSQAPVLGRSPPPQV